MVSIHGPLGYEPNTLTTAPLRYAGKQHLNWVTLMTLAVASVSELPIWRPLPTRMQSSCLGVMTLAGLEPAIFGSEDQRLIH